MNEVIPEAPGAPSGKISAAPTSRAQNGSVQAPSGHIEL